MNDVLNGRRSLDDVLMSEWAELVVMAMIDGTTPHLNVDVAYKGAVYSLHHCVETISVPGNVGAIKEHAH